MTTIRIHRSAKLNDSSDQNERFSRAIAGLANNNRAYWAECTFDKARDLWTWTPDLGARNRFGAEIASNMRMIFMYHNDTIYILACWFGAAAMRRAEARLAQPVFA